MAKNMLDNFENFRSMGMGFDTHPQAKSSSMASMSMMFGTEKHWLLNFLTPCNLINTKPKYELSSWIRN